MTRGAVIGSNAPGNGETRPKVSVCIVTYNHEPYITEAIESALCQKTDFPFEIRVGEDDSTDRTREIVRDFDKIHSKVTGLYRDVKDKIYIDGKPTGRFNFIDNIRNAEGDYIAILEGDDYWIDDTKLQRQVELLEADKAASFCFHRIYDEDPDGSRQVFPRESRCKKSIYDTADLLEDNFIPTASVMIRNRDFDLPPWILEVPFADWPMHILNSLTGHAIFLDEVMAVRRNHGRGMWSALDDRSQDTRKLKVLCTLYLNIDAQHREILLRRISDTYRRMIRHIATAQGPVAAYREWQNTRSEICIDPGATRMLTSILSGTLKKLYKKPKAS